MDSEIRYIHKKLMNKEVSCVNLIQERLDLLKENRYNTVNFLLADRALALATKVDAKIAKGIKIGLLEGIPFGVKDVFMLQGEYASASSNFLKNYKAAYTATAIQKLLDAGAIPLVKENSDAFGHGSSSENTIFGAVKNAINPTLVGGGSSGGSAVNVAKNYTVFSIGGDTGGSVRQPAGYNGIYGLKPTYGRVSRYGIMAYASSTDCVGVLAKTAEDIRLVFNEMKGKDIKDLTTFKSDAIDSFTKINSKKISVGYYKSFIETESIDPKIKKDFNIVLEKLKAQGVIVKALDFFDLEILGATYYTIAMAETASNLSRLDGTNYGARIANENLKESYAVTRSENFSEESKRRIVAGNQLLSQGHSDAIYLKALRLKDTIATHFTQDFKEVDILLSPVTPKNIPKIGSLKDPNAMYLSDAYTVGFSLGQLPTLTIPKGTATGIQISADKNQEQLILNFSNFLNELL